MTSGHIPPEHFLVALGALMEMASKLSESCQSIGTASECHYMRRAKQIKNGETPLENVPLAVEIATLRQLEHQIKSTRAMFEIVETKNRQLDGPELYLVRDQAANNSGE